MTTPAEAVTVLNRIHATDPTVLPRLIERRVACNRALAADPTVQVGNGTTDYEVGILGILNGVFGIGNDGLGHIAAHYDGDILIGFKAQ
jgi:hypothetical protein